MIHRRSSFLASDHRPGLLVVGDRQQLHGIACEQALSIDAAFSSGSQLLVAVGQVSPDTPSRAAVISVQRGPLQ